jgi:hypothetical protein
MNTIKIIILVTILYICYLYFESDIENFKSYNINILNDNCGKYNQQINSPWYYYNPWSYYYPYNYVNPYNFMYPPNYY